MSQPDEPLADMLPFPMIAKPLHEGSSRGLSYASVVDSQQALADRIAYLTETYEQPVLVEQFVEGREFTVLVLGNTPPRALPLIEIRFKGPRNIALFQPADPVIRMLARLRDKRLVLPVVYTFQPHPGADSVAYGRRRRPCGAGHAERIGVSCIGAAVAHRCLI
ncbi:D-alanine--D-alanine ligase [Candidatus Entotheonellaceae bacterium PAL068K]